MTPGIIGQLTPARVRLLKLLALQPQPTDGRARRRVINQLDRMCLCTVHNGIANITAAGQQAVAMLGRRAPPRRVVKRPDGLASTQQLAEGKPHGDRVRYVAGCRCQLCTKANRLYARSRKAAADRGEWNGLVDAGPARAHILKLSKAGVGRRTIEDVSDIAGSIIHKIRQGTRTTIRVKTEQAILRCTADAVNDATLVKPGPTRKRIRALLASGFTKTELAHRLGYKTPALQLCKTNRITAKTELLVKRFYDYIMVGGDDDEGMDQGHQDDPPTG